MGDGGHEFGGEGEEEDDENGPNGDEDEEGIPMRRRGDVSGCILCGCGGGGEGAMLWRQVLPANWQCREMRRV